MRRVSGCAALLVLILAAPPVPGYDGPVQKKVF